MEEETRYRSRRFMLAVFFALATVVGLFTGHLGGGEFVASEAAVLGLYAAANTYQKVNGK